MINVCSVIDYIDYTLSNNIKVRYLPGRVINWLSNYQPVLESSIKDLFNRSAVTCIKVHLKESFGGDVDTYIPRLKGHTIISGDLIEEFSTWPCDFCNSNLAGQRYSAERYSESNGWQEHCKICIDCLYNGT